MTEAALQMKSFAIETYLGRTRNYLERMVDREGLPYFNIFRTQPAEAAHDWPDYGDVMARQLQAAIMLRQSTGLRVATEDIWRGRLHRLINPADGLLYREATSFCQPVANLGDQSLTLYALATDFAASGDPARGEIVRRMVNGLYNIANRADGFANFPSGDFPPGGWDEQTKASRTVGLLESGFMIKSLMCAARVLQDEQAFDLAGGLARGIMDHSPCFAGDRHARGNHMHGALRALCGVADYAIAAGDRTLLTRVAAVADHTRALGTRFGFIPEVVNRGGDIIACETCALMDYMGLMVTLANHGWPKWWGEAERLLRNQLVESQAGSLDWLASDNARADTDQFSWREIGERMRGGWAGWSSPTHLLATDEELHWGGPELRGKIRAFQNCCGGSGGHALYIAWANASRVEGDTLTVNLHVDRALREAEIRCAQPHAGRLTVDLKEGLAVRIRMPDFVAPESVWIEVGNSCDGGQAHSMREIRPVTDGVFADLGHHEAGQRIVMTYDLPVTHERVAIGNAGFQSYAYDVTWQGDTVLRIDPEGEDKAEGYSDFEQRIVKTYYGEAGPSRLYQRPTPSLMPVKCDAVNDELHAGECAFNFWKF